MNFLGYEGSYFVPDEDAFRAEVLALFGIEVGIEEQATENTKHAENDE